MNNPLGDFDGTAFLNAWLKVLADIVSEKENVKASVVATPKTDLEKKPA